MWAASGRELRAERRQLANRAAKRLDFVMRVVRVHFRRCVAGKLLSDFDRHSGVRHDAREKFDRECQIFSMRLSRPLQPRPISPMKRSIIRYYTRSGSLRFKLVAHLLDLRGLRFKGTGESRNVFLLLRHRGL